MLCVEDFTTEDKISDGYYLILTDKTNKQITCDQFIDSEALINYTDNYNKDNYIDKNIFYYANGKCDVEKSKKLCELYFKN